MWTAHNLRTSSLMCTQQSAQQHAWGRPIMCATRRQVAINSTIIGQQSSMVLLQSLLDQHLADSSRALAISSCAMSDKKMDDIYDAIDEIFYSKGGFVIPKTEKARIDATGGSASYGEVQASGIDQIMRYLALDSNSIFMDLGCGRGRAVLQVAMHSPVKASIGLELSDSRLEQAEMALGVLQEQGVQLRPVEFRQADLSSCSLQEGTHFYLCSTAFGAGICRSIAERLQASPNFQALITSRQLPTQPYLYKLAEVPCKYSFNAAGKAYVYVKSLAEAPPAVLAQVWCRDGVCWLPAVQNLQLGVSQEEPLHGPARQYVKLGPAAEESAAVTSGVAEATQQQQQQQQQK